MRPTAISTTAARASAQSTARPGFRDGASTAATEVFAADSQRCRNSVGSGGAVARMPLAFLSIEGTRVADLSPLEKMPLMELECSGTPVSDLSPLKGMRLTKLICEFTRVSDVSPLKGMPLTSLDLGGAQVSDLAPLEVMPFDQLNCGVTQVIDLSPLHGAPLTELECDNTKVLDLSPLTGMNLLKFAFTPAEVATGIEAVRQMKSLQSVGTSAYAQDQIDAGRLWQKYDAGGSINNSRPLLPFDGPGRKPASARQSCRAGLSGSIDWLPAGVPC